MYVSHVAPVLTAGESAAVTLALAAPRVALPFCTVAPAVNSITCHSIVELVAKMAVVSSRLEVVVSSARTKSLPLYVAPSERRLMRGTACVNVTAAPSVTSSTAAPGTRLPRCTETPLVNSATYHFTLMSPIVPLRANVTVVASVSWPATWPSTGSTELSAASKTRNALVVSTAVMVAVADDAPFAIVALPDCTSFTTAAWTRGTHRNSGRKDVRKRSRRRIVTVSENLGPGRR